MTKVEKKLSRRRVRNQRYLYGHRNTIEMKDEVDETHTKDSVRYFSLSACLLYGHSSRTISPCYRQFVICDLIVTT